jgi:hypothetical protein
MSLRLIMDDLKLNVKTELLSSPKSISATSSLPRGQSNPKLQEALEKIAAAQILRPPNNGVGL